MTLVGKRCAPARLLSPGNNSDVTTVDVADTNYGFLGGLGVDATDQLRFDAGTGYFQQGRFNLPDVRGRHVYTYGASARALVHKDMPVPQSVDFTLYKNDPMAPTTSAGRSLWTACRPPSMTTISVRSCASRITSA